MALLESLREEVAATGIVAFALEMFRRWFKRKPLSEAGESALHTRNPTTASIVPAPPASPPTPQPPVDGPGIKYITVHHQKVLNPAYVMANYLAAPFGLRDAVAGQFIGLRAGHRARLHSVETTPWNGGKLSIHVAGTASLFADVDPAGYPGLQLLNRGDEVTMAGLIAGVSKYGVTLEPNPDLVFE